MTHHPLDVLYEDNHLLAVLKPAGLATMGVAPDRPSLLAEAKEYLRRRYHKPGNVYLGVVSRLDAPVTGIVLLARTSKAAARLNEQFRTRAVEKIYWALVEGHPRPAADRSIDWLVPDARHRRVSRAAPETPGAQRAELQYRELCRVGPRSLLEVTLVTGRKHQIRVQLALRGHPVAGDRKYGSPTAFEHGIALHSRRLVFEHPVQHEPIELEAPLPRSWQQLGLRGMGGL